MNIHALKTKKGYKFLFIGAVILVLIYLLANLLGGKRSIFSLFSLSKQHQELQEEIKSLEQQHQKLEDRIRKMRNESMDLDLLDEKARAQLGYSKKGETVYVEK